MPHNGRHQAVTLQPRRVILRPKPKRLGKRKRVTLIAAIRYVDGVVLCADSQETVGDYRVSVDKIKPRDCNHYELVVGGAAGMRGKYAGLSERPQRGRPRS